VRVLFAEVIAIATKSKTVVQSHQDRAEQSRQFAIEAARLAANTRGQDVVVLDVSNISPVTDYYVLVTGTSSRQMRTVIDDIAEMGGERFGIKPLSSSGYDGEQWILADFVDVVVHVFSGEARSFYDLDNLWGDAKKVDWQSGAPQQGKKQG
jgi:ribosome-associated protein